MDTREETGNLLHNPGGITGAYEVNIGPMKAAGRPVAGVATAFYRLIPPCTAFLEGQGD